MYLGKIDKKIYEELFLNSAISFLKDISKYKSKEIIDPMSLKTTKKSKWTTTNKYYYTKSNNNLILLKLKKKNVLTIFNKKKRTKIKAFAKQNDLSFKNENDVVRIFKEFS